MKKSLDIFYLNETVDGDRQKLDVYHSENKELSPVLIFIHGGTWISGSKDMYQELGNNFAKHGYTAVLINYRLATDFRNMAHDCAGATKWVYENIEQFGGDRNKIYLSGHSAGGHLAALISLDSDYFKNFEIENPVKGCILIDAFGLNIGEYISIHGAIYMQYIAQVFTTEPNLWKKASPVNFIDDADLPPFLIFTGSETYPFLIKDNLSFIKEMKRRNHSFTYEEIPEKSHQQMVTQLADLNNSLYDNICSFTGMKKRKLEQ